MLRVPAISLSAVILLMMITAGCFQSSGPTSLMTTPPVTDNTPLPAAPPGTGTQPPAAAGTQVPAACTAGTLNDAANCGGCGYACPANAVCQAGQCSCRAGFVAENNRCILMLAGGTALQTQAATVPTSIPATVPSSTVLPETTATTVVTTTPTATFSLAITGIGFGPSVSKACFLSGGTVCNTTCVNLSTSNSNCGSCGHTCSGLTATCCNGACTNLKTSKDNCGSCGHQCSELLSCVAGSCQLTIGGSETLSPQQQGLLDPYI